MPKLGEIVGYTFRAANYCPTCICAFAPLSLRQRQGLLATSETLLTQWASAAGVDRDNETSFDSGVFPKVILGMMLDGSEHCGMCHKEI